MGGLIDNYDIALGENVLRIILITLNSATLILTVFNWYSLRSGFRNMKIYDRERRRIIWFYYEITLVPLLVAGCGNYGAQYPKQAIWIFPSLQIFLAFNFFWFLGMMYGSAGGFENVKYHLSQQQDRCGFPRMENKFCCKCCMRKNLWIGMKSRLWYLYLIYIKPLWAFSLSVMYRINESGIDYDFPEYANYTARALVLLCTLMPLNAIKCFVVAIQPISRLNRITPKLVLIRIMVPLLQIQQLTITFLVQKDYISDLNDISSDFRGSRIEGTLLSFEMLIVAMASHFIYRAEDLKHWEHKQQYLWQRQPPHRRTTAITNNDNESHLNDVAYSELSGMSQISALSINASSLLGPNYGVHKNPNSPNKNKINDKKPLLVMPEDHSLRDPLTTDHSIDGYNSVDDK